MDVKRKEGNMPITEGSYLLMAYSVLSTLQVLGIYYLILKTNLWIRRYYSHLWCKQLKELSNISKTTRLKDRAQICVVCSNFMFLLTFSIKGWNHVENWKCKQNRNFFYPGPEDIISNHRKARGGSRDSY